MATHFGILIWRIPKDRRAWLATVHRVANTEVTYHACMCVCVCVCVYIYIYIYIYIYYLVLNICVSKTKLPALNESSR